jgi:hypothetical protein
MQHKPVILKGLDSWWKPGTSRAVHVGEDALTFIELKKSDTRLVLGRHFRVGFFESPVSDIGLPKKEVLLPALQALRKKVGAQRIAIILPDLSFANSVKKIDHEERMAFKKMFKQAGFSVKHVEGEDESILRLLQNTSSDLSLLVRVGERATTSMLFLNGRIIRTSMSLFGINAMTFALTQKLNITLAEAQKRMKDGIHTSDKDSAVLVVEMLSHVARDIETLYLDWSSDMKKSGQAVPPLQSLCFYGKASSVGGLVESLSEKLRVPAFYLNVWKHVLSLKHTIPALHEEESRDYAEAIGGALRAYRK